MRLFFTNKQSTLIIEHEERVDVTITIFLKYSSQLGRSLIL
jgi:hypothetical protein